MDAAQDVIDQVPEAQRFVASMRRRRERERNPPKGSYHHHHPEYQKLFGIAEDKYQQYSNYCQAKTTHPEMANQLYNEYSKAFKQYKVAFESHNKRQQTAMRLAGVVQRPNMRLLQPLISPSGQLLAQLPGVTASPSTPSTSSFSPSPHTPVPAPTLVSPHFFQQRSSSSGSAVTAVGQYPNYPCALQSFSPYNTNPLYSVSGKSISKIDSL